MQHLYILEIIVFAVDSECLSLFLSGLLKHNLSELARLLIDAVGRHVLIEFEVGEALENLLERRLTDGVVLKLVLFLELLDQLEEETDGLVVPFDSQTHVIAIVLDHFDIDEFVAECLDDAEESTFDEDVRSKLLEAELAGH